jgi:hypothetical protein
LELVSKIYLAKSWLCFFAWMSTMIFPCSQFNWQDFLDKVSTWLNLMNSWLENLEPISFPNLCWSSCFEHLYYWDEMLDKNKL